MFKSLRASDYLNVSKALNYALTTGVASSEWVKACFLSREWSKRKLEELLGTHIAEASAFGTQLRFHGGIAYKHGGGSEEDYDKWKDVDIVQTVKVSDGNSVKMVDVPLGISVEALVDYLQLAPTARLMDNSGQVWQSVKESGSSIVIRRSWVESVQPDQNVPEWGQINFQD